MNWNWWCCPERASYRSKRNRSNNPRSSSRRGANTPQWNRRSTRWKSTAWTCAQTMESAASSAMLRWRWWQEISTASARFCGSRSKSVRRERENILIATPPTSSQRKRRGARRTSVIPAITACARPAIENLTQRTANPVMREIKFQKTAARVKIGPADFLKTGVFWRTLAIRPRNLERILSRKYRLSITRFLSLQHQAPRSQPDNAHLERGPRGDQPASSSRPHRPSPPRVSGEALRVHQTKHDRVLLRLVVVAATAAGASHQRRGQERFH